VAEQDDEFLLDAPEALSSESNAVQSAEGDTEMVIDEEGRPKFAPAKNTVRIPHSILKSGVLNSIGWTTSSRNQKSPYPSSPIISFEGSLAKTLPTTCGAPQATG